MDLIRAAESGDIQSVHELLDRGADPNLQNDDDDYDDDYAGVFDFPLIRASYRGHIEIVRLLLD